MVLWRRCVGSDQPWFRLKYARWPCVCCVYVHVCVCACACCVCVCVFHCSTLCTESVSFLVHCCQEYGRLGHRGRCDPRQTNCTKTHCESSFSTKIILVSSYIHSLKNCHQTQEARSVYSIYSNRTYTCVVESWDNRVLCMAVYIAEQT